MADSGASRLLGPPLADAGGDATLAGDVIGAVRAGAGLESEVAPVAVFRDAGEGFVFVAGDTGGGDFAPAALGVGEAVETVGVLGAGAV